MTFKDADLNTKNVTDADNDADIDTNQDENDKTSK